MDLDPRRSNWAGLQRMSQHDLSGMVFKRVGQDLPDATTSSTTLALVSTLCKQISQALSVVAYSTPGLAVANARIAAHRRCTARERRSPKYSMSLSVAPSRRTR